MFIRRGLIWSLAVVVLACTSTPSSPPVQHAQYQYVATYPLGPFNPGDSLHIVWTPRLVQTSTAAPYDIRLCVGVFGPYGSVESLKQASSSGAKVDCPVASAAVATEVLRAQSGESIRMEATLKLPSQPGFYDVREVAISGSDPARSATSAAGIIESRGR